MNKTKYKYPIIGIGVIILKEGKILVGKRVGGHAAKYSIPGGKVELGETFAVAAFREIKEETNLSILEPKIIGLTNNLETFAEEGVHSISVILLVEKFSGRLKVMEPDSIRDWRWCEPGTLPEPHFDGSRRGVDLYLKSKEVEILFT